MTVPTKPEPMTDDRLASIRACNRGPRGMSYVDGCDLLAEVERLRERAETLQRERDELLGVIDWTATVLEAGSLGVPCDSEAASHLGDTIDKALRSLSVARDAAAALPASAHTPETTQ